MKILINSERRTIPPTTLHPRDHQEYCQDQTREAFLPQSGWLSINIYWDISERAERGEGGEGEERERGQCLDNYVEC